MPLARIARRQSVSCSVNLSEFVFGLSWPIERECASLKRSSFHEIGPQTVRGVTAPQPVLTSYKLLEIERNGYWAT